MATVFSGTNIESMNRKQLRVIASNVGVSTPVIHSNLTSVATLLAAIKAK